MALVFGGRGMPLDIPPSSSRPRQTDAPGVGIGDAAHVAVDGAEAAALDALEEAVQDDELELQLDAVDGGLEGALQVEQVRVLDAEERDVEADDEHVDVEEVVKQRLGLVVLDPRRGRGDGGLRRLEQRRQLAQVLARLPDVQDAEDGLLHEEDGRLETVPDHVDRRQGRLYCLLRRGLTYKVSARCSKKKFRGFFLVMGSGRFFSLTARTPSGTVVMPNTTVVNIRPARTHLSMLSCCMRRLSREYKTHDCGMTINIHER